MKAIIMAGGEGTRLRPLTCDCPKPMMRLMDRPVMEYAVALLARHGVTEAAVTLGYLPERISDYFGEESSGVKLRYYTERTPMGTAGGVAQARDFLTETFCVLSGDGVTDIDLTQALKFHREHNSRATIVLKRVTDPMAYGLVLTSPDGRITSFLEKPAWGEVVSDTVNTGIYILEPEVLDMISETPYDFGRDLFPKMAADGQLYGCVIDGYWCDIGDINAYMQVNRDALDGKIALPYLENLSGVNISPTAHVDESANLETPCFIAPGAVIGRSAHVGPYSVVGQGAVLGDFSGAKRAILWPGARLEEGAQARGCVLARDALLGSCARAFEGSVMGTGAVAGTDSELAPETSVWPGKSISEAVRQDSNLVWGASATNRAFHGGVLPVRTPGDALRFAQAYAACRRPREVLLARTPSAVASAIWHGCASGLMAQGVYVLDAGICTEPQLRYALSLLHADGALLADASGVTPFARDGCRISLGDQRAMCALVARQDFPQPFSAITHPLAPSGRSEHAYVAMLASAFTADPNQAPSVAVHSTDQYLLNLAERAFARAGLRARCEWEEALMELGPGEIGVWLEDGGARAAFSHEGGLLSDAENELLRAWTALEMGETRLVMGGRATRAISDIAGRYGADVTKAPGARPAWERAMCEGYPLQFRLATDGIFFALSALSALTDSGLALTSWLSVMPHVHRAERVLPLRDDRRGSILRSLAEHEYGVDTDDGLIIQRENGVAWISPDDSRPECRIVSESRDAEFARELCDFCENALRRAMETGDVPL
jgi:mannose-1-phosphate guanylyltransferase/phosphomannomutase